MERQLHAAQLFTSQRQSDPNLLQGLTAKAYRLGNDDTCAPSFAVKPRDMVVVAIIGPLMLALVK